MGLAALAFGAAWAPAAQAGTAKAEGVKVTSLRVTPKDVDTSRSSANVHVRTRITGPRLPGGVGVVLAQLDRVGGGAGGKVEDLWMKQHGHDGEGPWIGHFELPARARRGTYAVSLKVAGANPPPGRVGFTKFSSAKLKRAGFDNRIRQTGGRTGEGPKLKSLKITPESVNTDLAQAEVWIRVSAYDLHGVSRIDAYVQGPGSDKQVHLAAGENELVEGDALFGTWEMLVRVPRYSPHGRWRLTQLELWGDNTRRILSSKDLEERGFNTTFLQAGPGDSSPPVLREFELDPEVFTASPDPVVVEHWLVAEDVGFGVSVVRIELTPPGAGAPAAVWQYFQPTAGTANKGVWYGPNIAPGSGTYEVSVALTDVAGNVTSFNSQQLAAAGFTSTLQGGP